MTSTTDNSEPCSEIRERIPLYVGGDLDLGVLDRVSEHLQECPACQDAFAAAQRGREALIGSLRQREPDYRKPGLWQGVRAGLIESGDLPGEFVEVENTPLTPLEPALPAPRLVSVGADTERHAGLLTEDAAARPFLRRASAWMPLAAAACVLYFVSPFFGPALDEGLDEGGGPQAPDGPIAEVIDAKPKAAPIPVLPAAPASLAGGSGAVNATPVGFEPLRKLQPGEGRLLEELSDPRKPNFLRARRGLPNRGPVLNEPSLATFEGYQ